ncbi:MAG: hypothetical protein IJ317_00205, partial [Clostridia bacterium]|nr:hypothetical protein [Clostridia bacterium]
TMGNSVTTIEARAFKYCYNLTSVEFVDDSTWYVTSDKEDWQNKANGTQVDVSDAATAARWLRGPHSYSDCYWYKL